ncbi:MAG: hypothetical protein SGJ20_06300 [Planctomycetota bacterium]|nr:hypothetical protein [Planctomycetota bacterium]
MKPRSDKNPGVDSAELLAAIQLGDAGLCPSVRQQLTQLFSTLARATDPLRTELEEPVAELNDAPIPHPHISASQ